MPIVNNQPIVSLTEKTHAKCPIFILPDIFIRNIPSFPLTNTNKKPTKCLHTTNNIMNLSSDSKDYLRYPSVSKILNATMSESAQAALDRWRNKMIAQLGEEGFLEYHKGLLSKGSLFHSTVHSHLSGATVAMEPDIEGCWQSLSGVLPDITNVRALESHVVHSQLLYRGIIDCVAEYKNRPVLIEWKKSDKQKPGLENTYDAPVQLCAYLGAINYDNNYNLKVKGGLVVVAYTDGSPAHVFSLTVSECNKFWRACSVVRYLVTHPQLFTMKLAPSVPLRWTALLCLVLTCATCMYACVEHTEYKALSNHVVLLAGLVCNNPRKYTDNTMSYFLMFVAELLWVWSSWTAGTFSLMWRVCAVDIFTLYILRRIFEYLIVVNMMPLGFYLQKLMMSSQVAGPVLAHIAYKHRVFMYVVLVVAKSCNIRMKVALSLRKQPAYNFLWSASSLSSPLPAPRHVLCYPSPSLSGLATGIIFHLVHRRFSAKSSLSCPDVCALVVPSPQLLLRRYLCLSGECAQAVIPSIIFNLSATTLPPQCLVPIGFSGHRPGFDSPDLPDPRSATRLCGLWRPLSRETRALNYPPRVQFPDIADSALTSSGILQSVATERVPYQRSA
uniref:Mitochondrial genome maintenance exonuclease 1 n=1 Tax=Timema bartmani TaxID=61472 RepID=A0A7R9ETW5_9NEOP|nr:unnamed protein product [Timema bartmani]